MTAALQHLISKLILASDLGCCISVDTDNQPAEAELIEKVKTHIDENRPIGADVTVVSATALTVNITVKLTTDETPDIQQKIEDSIKSYLSTDALKRAYISYAKIGSPHPPVLPQMSAHPLDPGQGSRWYPNQTAHTGSQTDLPGYSCTASP